MTDIWNNGDYNISQFLVEWNWMYPQHMMGGYAMEQLHIWTTNPFEFVHKWPKFAHHLVTIHN